MAEFTIPPLTTVQMSQHELAKIAFRALMNEVECEPPAHQHHRVRTEYEPGAEAFYGTGAGGRTYTNLPQSETGERITEGGRNWLSLAEL